MKRPQLLGIVNITRDSFSDGSRYLNSQQAIEHALQLHREGADIIDLGPCASSPDAEQVSAQTEIERLIPVVHHLKKQAIPISIDSYQSHTQLFGLSQPVAFLNDIRGFHDTSIYPALSQHPNCKLIVMHSVHAQGVAQKIAIATDTILDRICQFFEQRLNALTQAGIAEERIILDPGMGWFLSTDPQCSLQVLQQLPWLKQRFNLPLLISVSRKSFLRHLTSRPVDEILPATLAAELFAAYQGVDYIRTHDVKALHDALTLGCLLWRNAL